jgi:hypothetical protein
MLTPEARRLGRRTPGAADRPTADVFRFIQHDVMRRP